MTTDSNKIDANDILKITTSTYEGLSKIHDTLEKGDINLALQQINLMKSLFKMLSKATKIYILYKKETRNE